MRKESVAIIGEGKTEFFYFDAYRISKRLPFKIKPDFPGSSSLEDMLQLAEKCKYEQYDYIICLIDIDRLKQYHKEYNRYRA